MDSSALFAAVLSPTGAARELIRLCVEGEIGLVISGDVIAETARNVESKAPEMEPLFRQLLELVQFEVVADPSRRAVRLAEAYVAQKDAFIVAAAIDAGVDFLATFDRKHLIDPPEVSEQSGLNVRTPGDILQALRNDRDQEVG